jgi:hypothetical protein
MKSKTVAYGVIGLAVAVAAYWYWSPYLTVRQMRSAAIAGDADTFNDHVDYVRLRESLKGQLSAALAQRMGEQPASDNEFAKAGSALGAMLGMAMVDRMVEAFVRPEIVMRAMQEGRMAPKKQDARVSDENGSGGAQQPVVWTTERKGVDKLIAYGVKATDDKDQRIGIVLERSGFAHWKLTEIRLPALR